MVSVGIEVFGPPTWRQLLEQERKMRSGLHEGCDPKDLKAWYGVVSHVLRSCVEASRSGILSLTPPVEVLSFFSLQAENLSRGIVQDVILNVSGPGRPPKDVTEERHVGWATLYIRLAKIGEIVDPKPIDTVCKEFSIERQVAQRWKRMDLPASLVAESYSADWVSRQMRAAGKAYRIAGRSAKSIARRASKR